MYITFLTNRQDEQRIGTDVTDNLTVGLTDQSSATSATTSVATSATSATTSVAQERQE